MTERDTIQESLAVNLRAARQALGWSIKELADKAGLEVECVRNAERGGGCSGTTLLQLSRALGIPVGVLMPDDPRSARDTPSVRCRKWSLIIVALLFLLVAVRTLLSSYSQ